MVQFVALSKEEHAELALSDINDLSAYVSRPTLPVYGAEISRLALDYPLAFIHQEQGYGVHLLCSLFSELPNAWITPEGKWLGHYIPAIIRQTPFTVMPNEEGKRIVCIDQDNSRLGDQGRSLFEAGEPTEFLSGMIKLLEKLYLNGVGTQNAIDLIASYELIVPWPLVVRRDEEEETPIKGVFRIDEAKLNQLEDDQWLALRRAGAIPLIYGQLLSMGHLPKLLKILQHKTDLLANNAVTAEKLDAFFGEDDDSALNFDSI
jgi:hypothetical protein